MKQLLLVIMVVATALVGCGKKESRAPIQSAGKRDARANGTDSTPGATDSMLDGQVFMYSDMDPSAFQARVEDFLLPVVPADYVGDVNGDYNNSSATTGVFIGGNVRLQSGNFNPNTTVNSNVTSNSSLLTVVYDEYTGQRDADGNTIPAIPVNLVQASGSVRNNQADIRFSDSYGSVTITGTINGSTFEGHMAYENSGSGSGKKYLGWFRVNTCAFFVCQ